MTPVKIITDEPTIAVLAEQQLDERGVLEMAQWVLSHRPNCVPAQGFESVWDLLPHDLYDVPHGTYGEILPGNMAGYQRKLTDNEVLVELAGRKCYDSFADAAGKKTNREYLEHIFSMDPIHSSILYHAKMTFFFAGVSRKFSHQFIRNYVGSDRDEEGSPSQESTRFTHHYGSYVAPPYLFCGELEPLDAPQIGTERRHRDFVRRCQANYDEYTAFITAEIDGFRTLSGHEPKGQDRKEIYEAAAGLLSMSAETSFVWTTNPMAIRKFLKERCHGAADAEIQRFAKKLARICFARWPNLFVGKDLDAVRAELAT